MEQFIEQLFRICSLDAVCCGWMQNSWLPGVTVFEKAEWIHYCIPSVVAAHSSSSAWAHASAARRG